MTPKRAKERAIKSFNAFIRERDGYVCYTCGRHGLRGEMDAGHFVTATHEPTRFNEINVHCQCKRCNKYLHGNLAEYAGRLTVDYGHKIIQELWKMSHGIKKWTVDELLEIERCYVEKLKALR
jgi:hypothetical protein